MPSAAAALLAPLLLEPDFLQLPAASTLPAISAASGTLARSAAQGAGQQQDSAAQVCGSRMQDAAPLSAWQAGMALLQQEWPALPGLLLADAMSACIKGEAAKQTDMAVSCASTWAWLLLQHAGGPQDGQQQAARANARRDNGKGYRSSTAASELVGKSFSWQPTQTQLRQLLAQCLASLRTLKSEASDAVFNGASLLDLTLLLVPLLEVICRCFCVPVLVLLYLVS